jgi:hypothetical protein
LSSSETISFFQIQFYSSRLPDGLGYKVTNGVVSRIKYPFQRQDIFDREISNGDRGNRIQNVSERVSFPATGLK